MLDERKITILTEIVDYYIDTAEPIGSRTLSKIPSIGLSSATLRNEMSDLEELGYLTKTHVSSGRIPSDKAYRLYVNHILEEGIKTNIKLINSLRSNLEDNILPLKYFYERANKLLSEKTNYITVIVSPVANSFTIEFIKLEALTSETYLLVLVGGRGDSNSYIINYNNFKDANEVSIVEANLKNFILNKSIDDLIKVEEKLSDDYPHREFYTNILNLAKEYLKKQDSYKVFLNGIGNIINFWNIEDNYFMKSVIDYLENEENLISMSMQKEFDRALDIRIGEENEDEILQEFTLMTSSYDNPEGYGGNITLIGPTRMDYKRVSNILYNFSRTLSGFKK